MDLKEVEEGDSGTAPTPVVQQQAEVLHFDSKPLNGLRGLAALHILIFHSLWYTEHKIHIYGNVRFYFSEIHFFQGLTLHLRQSCSTLTPVFNYVDPTFNPAYIQRTQLLG